MSEALEAIDALPDISFIDNLTIEDVQTRLINGFQNYYKELTGQEITLAKADPYRLIMLSCAAVLYQDMQQTDRAGKMQLLKYSRGDYLKEIAAWKNVVPPEPTAATVAVTWKLADAREQATGIDEGSRVTADNELYFETTEYAEIPAGETEITLKMTCTTTGASGNGYIPGEINILVDDVPFIDSVENTETSAGGSDEMSDDDLREEIYLAPSSYSTAGPDDAYRYWTKNYSSAVGDVVITSPSPGEVDVFFILEDGSIPGSADIDGMSEHLNQRGKRPLTDKVVVSAPEAVTYDIDVTYYINSSDSAKAVSIQEQAADALAKYQLWQSAKIGRDINPDELRAYLKNVGVKRMEVRSPEFTPLEETQEAIVSTVNLVYGGLEDD
jgi:phage-related baseplate assembly protein